MRDSGRLIPRGEEEYYAYDEEEEEEIAEIVGHDTYNFEEETIEELED
ncbi:DUF3134 family protein [Fischerella thermalis]|nr:DUF3134 family protein [Fischerella thermalis]